MCGGSAEVLSDVAVLEMLSGVVFSAVELSGAIWVGVVQSGVALRGVAVQFVWCASMT